MKEITTLLKELVKFRTTPSNPEQIEKCTRFIESYLKSHEISYELFTKNGVPTILVTPGNRDTEILFMSHIDVVDAHDSLFDPVEKDGSLYGRGTIDDKYAVALSLVLLKNKLEKLRSQGLSQADLPMGILISGDEETGGKNGSGYVLPFVKARFCITLDGGSVDRMVIQEKGFAKIKLTATGKSAHGARPWLGVNAIDILVDDLIKIRTLFQDSNNEHWHKTLNTGIIRGGESHNQVPGSAEAWLDIRYTENDDIDKIIDDIEDITESKVNVEFKEPLFTSPPSEYLESLLKISGGTVTCREHGASDARYLSKSGIPGIIWGADGDMSQHSDDEHISISSLENLYEIFDQFLNSL